MSLSVGPGPSTARTTLLAEAALAEAARMEYRNMNLETLPGIMKATVSLYCSLGFKEADAFGDPKKRTLNMSLDLD